MKKYTIHKEADRITATYNGVTFLDMNFEEFKKDLGSQNARDYLINKRKTILPDE